MKTTKIYINTMLSIPQGSKYPGLEFLEVSHWIFPLDCSVEAGMRDPKKLETIGKLRRNAHT